MSGGGTGGEREPGAAVRRLFARDPGLWGGDAETPELADRLGWLDAPQRYAERVPEVRALADTLPDAGFTRVVLLGMGGSSLAPEVFARTFGTTPGAPDLVVLDTTHPDRVLAVLDALDVRRTLFIVSSKSGSTIETGALFELCWERTGARGAQFIAITDPDTTLARLAAARGFRRCFENDPAIGGRFSALSYVGLVPAALTGAPVADVWTGAAQVARDSAAAARAGQSAGVAGAALGGYLSDAAAAGRDKLTLCTSPRFGAFGAWMEQLVAESTGKRGRGIVPVVEEPVVARPAAADRAWVAMIERGSALDLPPGAMAHATAGLLPVDLGAQFYEWEVATALAGAALGVNPFDQPNVAESKRNSEAMLKRLTAGAVPEPASGLDGLPDALARWTAAVTPGCYVALLAYAAPTPAHDAALARMRTALLRGPGVASTAGYGPRFLHSTGQLHKGGPGSGVFLQIETEPARDVAVPGAGYTLGQLILAQALGDHGALVARGRRVLRVRVGPDELSAVADAVEKAVA